MQYNPQYCTIVVRNTDGSGYLRQFKTLSEAKDAYASISASGAAVYLYQPPTKSLASFEAGEGIPDYNNGTTYGTGDKVKFQGKVYQLNNFIGAAGYDPAAYANLWTEVTSFTPPSVPPISSTGSPVTENGITRNPFVFNDADNSTPSRMTKIGCEMSLEREADGYYRNCAIYPKYRFTLQDGTVLSEEVGEKNTNGCFYPSGFKVDLTDGPSEYFRELKILNSLDFGGLVYGPYYQVDIWMGESRYYKVSDGNGGTNVQKFVGIHKYEGNEWVWEYLQDGETPYRLTEESLDKGINWNKLGQPIPNGNYLVTYKVDGSDKIHSGTWNVSVKNAGTYPKSKWVFTPQEPDQPPPPPCSILRKFTDPISGAVQDECDPDVIYPFTVEENCEPPLTVVLEGQTVTLGTNKKKGMDNGYGDVVWGNCSGMTYVPNGTMVLSGLNLNYFSDGQGSYYIENKNTNPCPPAGSVISNEQTNITVDINGTAYTIGYHYERTVADGNCGQGLEIGSEYLPNGTLIAEDENNKYYSNGMGSYYAEEICEPSGTELSSEQKNQQIFIYEIDSYANIGTYNTITYANGDCTTYTEDTPVTYIESGIQIARNNTYRFLSNGMGGYNAVLEPCPSAGTQISSDSGNYTVNYGCGDFVTGTYQSATFADGNCGTYTNGFPTYVSNGVLIGSCNGYNYYADGSGGAYQGEATGNGGGNGGGDNGGGSGFCTAYGTLLSGNSSDLTVYIEELGASYTAGSYSESTYADGNCGTYTESGNNWYSNGTQISSDSSRNFFSNGNGGYYYENICTPAHEFISRETSSASVFISELNDSFVAGEHRVDTFADGSCGTYIVESNVWFDYGVQIASGNNYNFFSNGDAGYYSEQTGPSCESYGTYLNGSSSSATVYISELNNNYNAGTYYESVYADGTCGTYTSSSTEWYGNGTLITSGNDYNFYSNGYGGYYSEYVGSGGGGGGGSYCDSYGTYVSGSSGDATVYISEIGSSYTAGSYSESIYADGNCGTYTSSSTSWYSYGTPIASDGSYNYYSDGNGSYYSQST